MTNKLLAIITGLIISITVYSQPRNVYTTTNNGSWTNVLNWDAGASPDNDQTDGSNDIIITHNITLTGNLTVKSGTTVTIEGCDTLHVTGNVKFNNGSVITVDSCAVFIIDGSLSNSNNSDDVIINGLINIAGDYSGGVGSDLGGSGSMDIDGTVTTDGDGTVFGSTEDCVTDCDNSNDDPLGSDPLPVELLYFNGQLLNGDVVLSWATASELNSYVFEIQRLVEVDPEDILTWNNWNLIGVTEGAGNSSTVIEYSFVDYEPVTGVNYYRLVQIDYDGQFEIFKTLTIDLNNDLYSPNLKVWPNPSYNGGDINIGLKGFKHVDVLIVVLDIHGITHYEKVMMIESNNTLIVINSNLPSGMYIVTGSTDHRLYKRKLVVD